MLCARTSSRVQPRPECVPRCGTRLGIGGTLSQGARLKKHERSIPLPAVVTYIAPMRRSLVSRLAALAIAMLVGFASPVSALAHGYAHHEASEHGEQDGVQSGAMASEATDELHGGLSRPIHAAYESMGHAHPQLARALPARMSAPLFVLSAIPAAVPVSIVCVSTAALPPTSAPPRACSVDALPRQPRAPPLG